ncbi:MAG: sensor histidine kinase [Planctomycetaceae bacterium]
MLNLFSTMNLFQLLTSLLAGSFAAEPASLNSQAAGTALNPIVTAISVCLAIFLAAQLVYARKRLADASKKLSTNNTEILQDDLRMRAQAERMKSLGQLAGGIAHDFNNLLVGVVTNAEILKQYHPQTDASNKCIDNILGAADLAAGLGRKLQSYANQQTPNKTICDLNQLVEPIFKLTQSSYLPIEVDFEKSDKLATAHVDTTHFEQIVLNLAENAKEAIADPSQGQIHICTGHEQLTLHASDPCLFGAEAKPGEYVFVEVRDNGVGLATADMIRFFEPMQSTKEGRSRGLGLSIVYEHVKRHDGLIRVRSRRTGADHGTSFRVLLPAAD